MKLKLILFTLFLLLFSGCTNVAIFPGIFDSQDRLITSQNLDAFERLRTAEPFGTYDNKNIMSGNEDFYEQLTFGTASIDWVRNKSAVTLTVGTGANDRAIRQSTKYHPYVPGKSNSIYMTGVLGSTKTNVVSRVGLFDDENGLFFNVNETGVSVVRRSSVSGSIVDTLVPQSEWNLDKLDGTGFSGVTLNTSKTQIYVIDFQWLGVGKSRMGVDIDGKLIYVHEFNHANVLTEVYMRTPTLPTRWEIFNTGVTASNTSVDEICTSVVSEGGYRLPGFEFSASSGINTQTISARTAVMAIRLNDTYNGYDNRRGLRLLHANYFTSTNDVFIEVVHVHNPTTVTGTWNSVSHDSATIYSLNSTITGGNQHTIDSTFLTTGQGNKGQTIETPQIEVNNHAYIYQNYYSNNSQMFVIYMTPLTGSADVSTSMSWIETE